MQIVLQVHAQWSSGRRLWLHQNQEARVGRSDWADFAVPHDPSLADVHFKVVCQPRDCRLVDLSRSPGTYVNGVRVVERTLAHGDEIRAGQTHFAVAIDVGTRARPPDAVALGRSSPRPRVIPHTSNADLVVLQSLEDARGPECVVDVLSAVSCSYAVVNDRRLGQTIAPPHLPCVDLLEGLPDVVRSYHSLWLCPLPNSFATCQFLRQTWGRDSMCIVASDYPLTDLAANLRHAAPSYLSPVLLRKQLLTAPAVFVQQLLTGVRAVVVEAEDPQGWLLFADPTTARAYQKLSCHEPPAA